MTLLLAFWLGVCVHADEIFDLRLDILVNDCQAHGPCKATRVGPFAHSIVLREKPEGLQGLYEWFDRIGDGYYVSVRVVRTPGSPLYRVQAYVANGDEIGAAASVSAWVSEPAALNRLQLAPQPQTRNGVVRGISLTLN